MTDTAETTQRAADLLSEALSRSVWKDKGGKKGAFENCFCVAALALNPDCRVFEVLEAMPVHEKKMDRVSFLNAISNLGSYARAATIRAGDIDPRLLPCLFIPDANPAAPAVILKDADGAILVHEGAENATRDMGESHPLRAQAGEAWFFRPFDANRMATSKFMRGGTGNTWFRALIGRFSDTFFQVVLAGLALNVVALASPLYMMAVYDRVISPADQASLLPITLGVVIALCAEFALRNNRSKALSWLSARLDNIVGNKIFAHLVSLPPELVERASVAAQIARIKTFESVRDLFSGSVFLSFLEIPYVVLALLLIGIIAGPLVMIPLLMVGCYCALFWWMRRKIKVVIRLAAKASSVRQQFTIETFEKMPGIHAAGLARTWGEKYEDLSGREIAMNFHLGWLGTVAETAAQALTLLSAVATVSLGAHYIWSGDITTGALIATMMLVWRVLTPFYSLCAMIPRLEQLRNSIVQVNDLMDIETELETARTAARLPVLRGRLTFAATTLRYGAEADAVIAGFAFDALPGSFTAVTGRNGSGKTSLLKMAKGMLRPQGGAVRIDGFDMRQLDPQHLRRHIAYVPQKPEFFGGTYRDNLVISRPLATEAEIEQALALADMTDDVKNLPQGLATPLHPGKIPAGLAAKMSLARAYLHGGAIMLIDELPGSLLHDRAGTYLRRYIEKQRGKKTIVMVTHNPDFTAMADDVFEMRKGETPRKLPRAQQQDDAGMKETA